MSGIRAWRRICDARIGPGSASFDAEQVSGHFERSAPMRTALQPYGPTAPAPDFAAANAFRSCSSRLGTAKNKSRKSQRERERERERGKEQEFLLLVRDIVLVVVFVIAGIYASSEVLRRARGSELGTS